MASTITYKKLVTVFSVVLIAIMLNVDDDANDIKLVDKQARLPTTEIKTFQFISQLTNLKYVCF